MNLKPLADLVHLHWHQRPDQIKAPTLWLFGLAAVAAALHGLLAGFTAPAYWIATALAAAGWLVMVAKAGHRFSLAWLPALSVGSLAFVTTAIYTTGRVTPFGLMLYGHAVFSALFFRRPFGLVMQVAAVAVMASSHAFLPANPHGADIERTLVMVTLVVMSTLFLDKVLKDSLEQSRQNRHLALINSVVRELAGNLDQTALDRLCRRAMEGFRAQECVLVELTPDGHWLVPRAVAYESHFADRALVTVQPRPIGKGAIGWVAAHGEPILTGDLARDGRFFIPPDLQVGEISAMVVPVPREGSGVAGVFRIQREGLNQFTLDDFDLCCLWAGEVGKVLDRARLHNQLKTMATTDSLSGTFNRHYLNSQWPALIEESQQSGQPVTFLMLDCFNFKQINDRYGHMMGDQILRELGHILTALVPAQGFAVRYGGDEFLVVLPGTPQGEGLALKVAIETELDKLRTRKPDWPPAIVDIGVYSGQGEELTTVLSRVDAALYDAKEEGYRQRLAALLQSSLGERTRHMVQAVMTLTRIQELNDPYTRGHTERARELAMAIGRRLGLTEDLVQVVGFGAVLHDVGKIVVPPEILNKPGPLTEEEWAIMRMHPQFGANIVGELDLLKDVHPIILHHHERYDGDTSGPRPGYPAGLKGEAIPVGARIVAVVDAFDAITTDRVYRKGRPVADALAELQRMAGSQFDPRVVAALAALVEEGALDRHTPKATTDKGAAH